MINLKKNFLLGSLFITYKEGLKGTIFLKRDNKTIPIELAEEDLSFISLYPNIMKKLINGEELYLNNHTGYLGKRKTEGPYCEQQMFVSKYDATNPSFLELVSNLDNKVKAKEKCVKKLQKIGPYYTE